MYEIKDSLFGDYDLRGIVGDNLTDKSAYMIGLGYGSYVQEKGYKKVVVGYDNRLSSNYLTSKLIKGLLETGMDVINIGLVTTPMLYAAKYILKLDCGIMVTASHNPKEYNGFKISFDDIGNAYGEKIRDFRDYIKIGNFKSGKGTLEYCDIKEDYLKLIESSIDINKKIKVVVDCGNGTGSVIVRDIFNMFDIDCTYIYCDSDGNFPNHHPDPSHEENMEDLKKKVIELNADLGIAFDGDADRIGFVDNLGHYYTADYYLLLMARSMRERLDKLLFDVKCSKVLIDECEKDNIKPCIYKTGASYANMEMKKGNYLFGGEYSGHAFYRDKWPGFDDGIYAGLRLIEMLANSNETISDMLKDTNKYYNEYIEYNIDEEKRDVIMSKVIDYVDTKKYKYLDIDGVRVEFDDGFALVRPSNTTPMLTIRFEADTKERLNEIKEEFISKIDEIVNNL